MKVAIWLLTTFLLTTASAQAQQSGPVYRIGYLSIARDSRSEVFRQALRELGYVEGKNIVIEWRFDEGKADRRRAHAAELARLKMEVIVTGGTGQTRAAKEVTSTIPVVMIQDRDPVGERIVDSLARPGGNVTGLSTLSPELSGKHLELLKEIVPRLSRVAVFGRSTQVGNVQMLREIEVAAQELGVRVHILTVASSNDIETAFRFASRDRADAILFQVSGPRLQSSPNAGCRTSGKESPAGDIPPPTRRRSRGSHVLRCER